jgi:ParB family chromosome partitioning protein
MAENKGFDLSALIGSVPELGTERQQITYIPIEKILPNGENFYSLDGLDELAGSIETLGLQQPLLVRPIEGGKYELISGHRRRAAILMIRDGGSQQFAEGVPCIVDESDDSPAVRKFKLLMANNDTRKMTSADQNRQAEELENVLRELEDEGYPFPGRLRDWVSKLSGMSRSKLNRLKVIRDKLAPEIKTKYYDSGRLNESCAYELAQMPAEEQRELIALVTSAGRSIERLYASDISDYLKDKARFSDQKCRLAKGESCSHVEGLLGKLYDGSYSYKPCRHSVSCCAKCDQYLNCKHRCPKLEEKAKAERAKKKAETADERARQKAKDEHDVRMIEHVWARYGQALRRAGKTDKQLREELAKDQRTWGEFNCYLSNSTQQALLDYENADATPSTALPYGHDFKVWDYVRLVKYADALGVSLDYLFLRSEDPEGGKAKDEPEEEPEEEDDVYMRFGWKLGEPPQNMPGWYAVRAKIIGELTVRKVLYWDGEGWLLNDRPNARPIDSEVEVLGWFPLPGEEE